MVPSLPLRKSSTNLFRPSKLSLRLRHGYLGAVIGRKRDAHERSDPGEGCLEPIGTKLRSLHPQEVADLTERTCELVLSEISRTSILRSRRPLTALWASIR